MFKNGNSSNSKGTKDLVIKETFPIQVTNIGEVIAENLGGETLDIGNLDQIKVPAGGSKMWSIPTIDGDLDKHEFTGVLIHTKLSRVYWEEKFSGGGSPPDCFSTDMITGVGNPGGVCSKCPQNEFGSADNGRGKACSEKRMLFFLTEDNMLPVVVVVPASSLEAAKNYLIALTTKHRVKKHEIITKLTLEVDQNKDGIKYSKIKFTPGARLENAAEVKKYAADIMPMLDGAAVEIAKANNGAAKMEEAA